MLNFFNQYFVNFWWSVIRDLVSLPIRHLHTPGVVVSIESDGSELSCHFHFQFFSHLHSHSHFHIYFHSHYCSILSKTCVYIICPGSSDPFYIVTLTIYNVSLLLGHTVRTHFESYDKYPLYIYWRLFFPFKYLVFLGTSNRPMGF